MNPNDREARLFAALDPFTRLELQIDPLDAPVWRADAEARAELIDRYRAGELHELTVPITATTELERPLPLPYADRRKATANFTRFRLEEFEAFAASFADQPFLRDHSSRSTDAGGRILSSAALKRRSTHLIRQEVLLVKGWAIEDALDGTMRAFSIGWAPRERGFHGFIQSAWCTVCDGPMFGANSECSHWPGDVVKLGEDGKRFIVELEWRDVIGRETSEVTFPAAAGTGIAGPLRALSQLAASYPELRSKETDAMDPKLLAQLGLTPEASAEDVAAAIDTLKRAAKSDPDVDLELERARRRAAEADRDRHAKAAKAASESRVDELRRSALERGLFRDGGERADLLDLVTSKGKIEDVENLLKSWENDPEVPVSTPVVRSSTPAGLGIGRTPLPHIEGAHQRGSGISVSIPAGGDEREKFINGASAWMIIRAGADKSVRAAMDVWGADADKKLGAGFDLDPGEFRGRSCSDLARICLERAGEDVSRMDKVGMIGRALTMRSAYNTTADFPLLLENVMHKMLMAAYAVTPDTWRAFCAVGRVEDFRPHNRYRMGSFGRLQKVNEHGEFTNQQIPDSRKETIAADTLGNIIGISRQSLINDDMGAFSRLTTMAGRAAKLSIEADVYDLLGLNAGLGPDMADGNALFDASHDNIGTGSDLTHTGIDADATVMAEQTDETGNEFLDLQPDVLVVPRTLRAQGLIINNAEFDTDPVDPGTDEGNKYRKPNAVRGLFTTVVATPRLTGTRRYLFAAPSVAPTIEVAFLDGQEEPFLEVKDGWRVDGVEWKIRHDYGVDAVDYKTAVTNAGAE